LNRLKHITLVQFRNYSFAEFDFQANITCITGPNGSGKTNLLDAVYYLCYTKSYFSAYQQNSVQKGLDGFRIEGSFDRDGAAETISCKWKQGKKEVIANGVEYERVTDHIGRYAAVMIAPDDMELINEGSEQRRHWVDSILGQTDKEYLERLLRYQRILLQRNAWLKLNSLNPPSNNTELDYYNRELAADGTYIHEHRKTFLTTFLPTLNEFYHKLSGGKERISVAYESDLATKPLAAWLAEGFQHDLRLQRTLRGIHKDDWNFMLDGSALKTFGSQGQKKSFLFAMKLAQFSYLSKELGHIPILLLDDIFEKLDQDRMEALLSVIRGPGFGQVILTDTHFERVQAAFGEATQLHFIQL
jgi:DNA replication and repair protein RecF